MRLLTVSASDLIQGGVYEDKVATLDRFRKNYVELVPEHVKARLVLENDEICYNVADLLPICQELNIPLILDYHHDSIYRSPLPPALMMADILATWSRKGIRCKQHLSEARYGARTMPERRGHSDRCQELPLGLEESIKIMKGREERGEPYEEREGWSEEGWVEGGAGFEGIREFGTRMGLPDDVDLMIEAKGPFASRCRLGPFDLLLTRCSLRASLSLRRQGASRPPLIQHLSALPCRQRVVPTPETAHATGSRRGRRG